MVFHLTDAPQFKFFIFFSLTFLKKDSCTFTYIITLIKSLIHYLHIKKDNEHV